ncbi:uncharacterized protein C12orf40-like isoform X2 [Scyliorhinus canicula]|uniref:uncharacterized protein C12orf40-like isoform X2 n=1 Tax=Scyliorhinus canicula TaxID=7830 RepID=UPI0018F5EB63|nr:uncharacterized protein C12orf40-like isoform X2 [Scyliorhinus canicula]
MNWVGGVRNRIKLKQQKKQQKEFFEKRKLKSKFKLLGSPLSPQQNSSVSWDLLTLHIVNRIAAKKEPTDMPNKVIQVDMKKDTKMPIRQHNIELPMSPCSTPSRIFLEESQCSSQEKEWNSRTKHFDNMINLKYGELSPVMESKSLEHNVMDTSLMERLNGYPLLDSWTCAQSYSLQENLSTELPTSWDLSNDNRQHLQQHFLIQGGMTPLIETTEHAAVLTEHIVPNCRNLPKHSNGRLLQNSLTESSGLHSNNDEEYAFAVQDTFPLSPKVASTSQSMTFHDRDFPLTQCFNSESSQLLSSHVCQEEFMHNLLTPAETNFKINAPYKRNDMPGTSVIGSKSVIQNRKNENIFIQPAANLFKEAVQKDNFGESNSHDEQFPESNLEFNVQENNGFFRGFEESWRSLNCRGTVLNDSFERSQSPSYSPKETESCCSVFSDVLQRE